MVCFHRMNSNKYYDTRGNELIMDLDPDDGRDGGLTKYDVHYKCIKCDELFSYYGAESHMEKILND